MIFIIEDHPAILEAYRRLIRRGPDLRICGEAESGEETLRKLATLAPTLLLMDLLLPGVNGENHPADRRRYPALPTILVVSGQDDRLNPRALEAGAGGYLHKFDCARHLGNAIRQVARGIPFVDGRLRAAHPIRRPLAH
ncbi:MAG: response regulator transcription factor [Caldilineaceae bacterium]